MRVGRLTAWAIRGRAARGTGAPAANAADVWETVQGTPPAAGAQVDADRLKAYTLDRQALQSTLAGAQKGSRAAAGTTVLAVPAPDGTLQRFAVQETSIMEAGSRGQAPGDQDLRGPGHRRPDGVDRRRHDPARLPRLGARAPRARGTSTRTTRATRASTSATTRATLSNDAGALVRRVRRGRREQGRSTSAAAAASSARRSSCARTGSRWSPTRPTPPTSAPANVTAAKVTLMNRVEPDLRGRVRDPAGPDRRHRHAQPQHRRAGDRRQRPVRLGAAATRRTATPAARLLNRNQIVIGQLVGADNYDIGHIALGTRGGGVAGLGVVGGGNKARGCTGLPTPVGDYFAVDYVAHEMGHQFAGNHTFNGTQLNCSAATAAAPTSVEPGSRLVDHGLRRHLRPGQPAAAQRPVLGRRRATRRSSSLVTNNPPRPLVNEVQNVSLRDFDGTDSFTLSLNGTDRRPVRRAASTTPRPTSRARCNGPTKSRRSRLTGYDTNGDSYKLSYEGGESHADRARPEQHRGRHQNALAGRQRAAAGRTHRLQRHARPRSQITVNGQSTPAYRRQAASANTNANIAAAINAILGFDGHRDRSLAQATAASPSPSRARLANTDVPTIAIVTPSAGTAAVREPAKGGAAVLWPRRTVAVGTVTDTGYTLVFGGTLPGTTSTRSRSPDATGATGTVVGDRPRAARASSAPARPRPSPGSSAARSTTPASRSPSAARSRASTSRRCRSRPRARAASSARRPRRPGRSNQGFIVTPTGNHAPDVTTPPAYTIPLRTPFALTGSATDADSDPLTYMWEQDDRPASASRPPAPRWSARRKTNGPLFRQFGVTARMSARRTRCCTHSPGLNLADANPTRVVPGHGADPGRQHERGHRRSCPVPPRRPRRRSGRARHPRVLLGVPADRRLAWASWATGR